MTKKSTKINQSDDLVTIKHLSPSDTEREFRKMFGEGLEEITDSLIQELKDRGFQEEDLINFQKMNYRYDRKRNSFFSPPNGGGILPNDWMYLPYNKDSTNA